MFNQKEKKKIFSRGKFPLVKKIKNLINSIFRINSIKNKIYK